MLLLQISLQQQSTLLSTSNTNKKPISPSHPQPLLPPQLILSWQGWRKEGKKRLKQHTPNTPTEYLKCRQLLVTRKEKR